MSDMQLQCWKCGNEIENLILPLSRREECSNCGADQHVCKLCKFYNADLNSACNEDRAEFVSDKESANFCDYFSPKAHAFLDTKTNTEPLDATARAKQELDALFSGKSVLEKESIDENGLVVDKSKEKSEKDKAMDALNDLFSKD